MKIALLTDGIFPYQIGGMQKHSFYLAKYLAKSGIEVDLYHTTLDGRLEQELDCFEEEERARIHACFIPFPSTRLKLPGHYVYRNYLYSQRVLEEVQKRELPDYFYAQGFAGWGTLLHKQNNPFPPLVVNFHGLNMFQQSPNWRARLEALTLRWPALWNLKAADCAISLGGKLTELLDKHLPASKIVEIPIGIEESWLGNAKEAEASATRKFLFVGRYDRVKGIEELTEVLRQLIDQEPTLEFHFVGGIPEEKQVRHPRITYHGLIRSEEKMKAIFAQSDIYVSSSHSEGMPTVILEAMASEMAIAATEVGAVAEQVSEANGWLFPPSNSVALKAAIVNALQVSDSRLQEMKQHSLQLVEEKFLWNQVINYQNELLEQKLLRQS